MKTLYLHRHAKSSWDHEYLTDFERPLNPRGLRDAPESGKKLAAREEKIDLFISSPAERAITTARAVVGALGVSEKEIREERSLYLPSVMTILKVVNAIDDKYERAMLFGHNPGFSEAVGYFTEQHADNLPTAGVVKITFPFDSWKLVSAHTGNLIFIDFPKNAN